MNTRIKTYLRGPMTGLPDLNFPAFFAAAAALRAAGIHVINPAEDGKPGLEWHEYLRQDIRDLIDCQAIHMLQGWQASKGARLELHIAKQLGMTVTFEYGVIQ